MIDFKGNNFALVSANRVFGGSSEGIVTILERVFCHRLR